MYFTIMIHTTELVSIANNTLHHCSSIVVVPEVGRIIAFYTGPECEDAQHVVIMALDRPLVTGLLNLKIELQPKTGNPLIWFDHTLNKYFVLYSLFEDGDADGNKPRSPVQRWMYCSTWFAELDVENFELKNVHEIKDGFGLLARCAPYFVGGRMLIPLYREKDSRCEIWVVENGTLVKISHFGDITDQPDDAYPQSRLGHGIAIQPTLIKKNDKLYALCRNVCMDAEKAWIFESDDDGLTWSAAQKMGIPNHNNSLTAIPWEDDYMLLMNTDKYRSEMYLGYGSNIGVIKLGTKIAGIRNSYSYPNYCIDVYGDLHVVHSNCGMLAVHKMDKEFVNLVMMGQSYRSK